LVMSVNSFSSALTIEETHHKEEVEVDVIVPVHNSAETIVETVQSSLRQQMEVSCDYDIHIQVCCYDDGSTDDSWRLLQELRQEYESKHHGNMYIPTTLLISKSPDGIARGAGYARNRAVDLRKESTAEHCFLCMLDSDDVMHPTRVVQQVSCMMKHPRETLLGCTFARDPPDATWHYTQWANGLSDERLLLEQFREVTLLQPTWMLRRSRFVELGGYLEAPSIKDMKEYRKEMSSNSTLRLVHPTYDTCSTLRVAEDLRFFHAHLAAQGQLQLLRTKTPLLTYRHRGGSQSSQTPRKLLLSLRVLAFESRILNSDPLWQGHFCIWGAGRDGKDFVKSLSTETRRRIYCFVDVDDKKINQGYYHNPQLDVRIPIVHFSLLARDPAMRRKLQRHWMEGTDDVLGFGRITKGKDQQDRQKVTKQPTKKRKLHATLDLDLLPELPVVVCVSMYRTNGALEHNVGTIGRTEGKNLWHFS